MMGLGSELDLGKIRINTDRVKIRVDLNLRFIEP